MLKRWAKVLAVTEQAYWPQQDLAVRPMVTKKIKYRYKRLGQLDNGRQF